MKKIILLFIILILPVGVKANDVEETLTALSKQIKNLKENANQFNLLDQKYPVGSIYITAENTNPEDIIGGTWERYSNGQKLVGVGNNKISTYSYNQSGGVVQKTITLSNMPAHTHTFTPIGTITSTFAGTSTTTSSTGSHTHTIGFGKASEEASGYGLIKSTTSTFYNRVLVTATNGDTTSTNGEHSHTFTPEGDVASTFEGDQIETSETGSNQSFSIQNPYITVYMWKRTA